VACACATAGLSHSAHCQTTPLSLPFQSHLCPPPLHSWLPALGPSCQGTDSEEAQTMENGRRAAKRSGPQVHQGIEVRVPDWCGGLAAARTTAARVAR
jgi:hypothetical protein